MKHVSRIALALRSVVGPVRGPVFGPLLVAAALGGAAGCNKPTQEECRQAITHMEELLGTEAAARNADNESEVRRCRGGSTKAAVDCAIKAHNKAELDACAFRSAKPAK